MPILPPYIDPALFPLVVLALRVVGYTVGAFFAYKAVKARNAGRNGDAIWFMLCALFFFG